MTHTLIYPHTTVHNAAGHLEIGGCDVPELADRFGTPLFIYDEQTLRDQCRAYVAAFADRTDDFEIVYACKAFSCRAMCELILEEGLSLDVASGGELAAARLAAAPPERIYFHGNNKSIAEIELGLETRIGHFVVDSFQEIEALNVAAAGRGLCQPVLVRLTPGVRPSTHSFVQTGQQDSKFGFGLADGMAAEAVRRIMLTEHLELVGVHAHIGSQIFDLTSYQEEVELLFAAVAAWQCDLGFRCRIFNFGGGLGIRYTPSDHPSSIAEFAAATVDAAKREVVRHGMAMPRILVEPGRSIAGKAAVTAYRVGTVKVIPGVRTYVAVDGGMSGQHAAHALRLALRGHDRHQGRRAGHRAGHGGRQALRVGRRARARHQHRAAGAGRRAGHAGHRRVWLRDGQQLQWTTAAGRRHGRRRRGACHHRARDMGRRTALAAAAAGVSGKDSWRAGSWRE